MSEAQPHADTQSSSGTWTLAYAVVIAAVAVGQRLLPHPYHMTMIGALGLWGGARLVPWLGLSLPIVVWGATDIVIWQVKGEPMFDPFVYLSFLAYGGLGLWLRRRNSLTPIVAASLLGSALFFLITNTGHWLNYRADRSTMPEGKNYRLDNDNYQWPTIIYADDARGLMSCYLVALPFWGQDPYGNEVNAPMMLLVNLIIGDLASTALFFGGHGLLLAWLASRRQTPATLPI